MVNPLATPDQIDVETTAARLREDKALAADIARVGEEWIERMQPDEENLARFAAQFEVAAFCGYMNAANDDPLYPKIHSFARLAHETNGYRIPSTKSGHPNIDYIYRFVPIDGTSHYALRGRVPENGPLVIEYAMLTAKQVYQKNVSLADLVIDPNGEFTITIDPEPAGNRPNHFQTTDESIQLLLRDVIGDPATQRPVELSIERLGPPPSRPAHAFDAMLGNVERLTRKHIDDLDYTTFEFVLKKTVNHFAAPIVNKDAIYSVAQAYSPGHFQIGEEEALVVNLTLAGAAYAVVPVTDIWGGVGDMLARQTALGTSMAAANPDGSYTFVVALRDPGVTNWVDPDGLRHGILFFRWIGLDPRSTEAPTLETYVARLSELDRLLPSSTPRIDPGERTSALSKRRKAYAELLG